jgi:hypothetical protein
LWLRIISRKLNFWNFIFQRLFVEFFLVSFHTPIGSFLVIWKSRFLNNFGINLENFYFSYQLDAKNVSCYLIRFVSGSIVNSEAATNITLPKFSAKQIFEEQFELNFYVFCRISGSQPNYWIPIFWWRE